ncbi:hypothetical protein SDJN03_16249, partial [Cucurbita argyrosperma subsp. sororia]
MDRTAENWYWKRASPTAIARRRSFMASVPSSEMSMKRFGFLTPSASTAIDCILLILKVFAKANDNDTLVLVLQSNCQPDVITLHTVMKGFCKVETVGEALKVTICSKGDETQCKLEDSLLWSSGYQVIR